ncbi:hypothetical protein L209DRAFT_216075 [Thermothelomyces heterothallicus CBS 203.75]
MHQSCRARVRAIRWSQLPVLFVVQARCTLGTTIRCRKPVVASLRCRAVVLSLVVPSFHRVAVPEGVAQGVVNGML